MEMSLFHFIIWLYFFPPFLSCLQNRGLTRLNKYCWTAIDDTPFIMAIALPETYGLSTIKGQIDATSSPDFNQYFAANDWYVHPDWVYCYVNPRNRGDPANKSINPASMIKMFLNRWRDEGEKAIDWIGSLETNAGGIASTKPFFCKKSSNDYLTSLKWLMLKSLQAFMVIIPPSSCK